MNEFDPFSRFYDADYGSFVDDVTFYRELARRTSGPILELMCGSGRVLVPLAQAGYRVTGVDISPRLLDLARRKLTAADLSDRAELVNADVRNGLPSGPFALAIVALNSFMHLQETDEQLVVLKHTAAQLEPGGVLALDLFNPDLSALTKRAGEIVLDKIFTLGDGTPVQKFVVQSANIAAQVNVVTFIYDELMDDRTVRRSVLPFAMRWLYRYELEHLLARAGFALEAVYGSYDLDEYDSSSELMLAVARKM